MQISVTSSSLLFPLTKKVIIILLSHSHLSGPVQ
jgi:hypothetical protein